jgi:hypothetical protein
MHMKLKLDNNVSNVQTWESTKKLVGWLFSRSDELDEIEFTLRPTILIF